MIETITVPDEDPNKQIFSGYEHTYSDLDLAVSESVGLTPKPRKDRVIHYMDQATKTEDLAPRTQEIGTVTDER